jgi:hypothetical protein
MKCNMLDKYLDHIHLVDKHTLSVIKHKNIPEFYELPSVDPHPVVATHIEDVEDLDALSFP